MSELWYPGRPPFCTEEITHKLTLCAGTLLDLKQRKEGHLIGRLENICQDLLRCIHEENVEALGSDTTLNNLTLFLDAMFNAAQTLFASNAWDQLQELAYEVTAVRDCLDFELQEVVL